MHMRKVISILGAWALVAMLAATALAQGTGRLNGEILDKDGKPFADQAITIKNPETGQVYNLKTDKNGKFIQLGMRSGIYVITLVSLNYSEKYQVQDAQENNYKLDLKQVVAASAAAHPDDAKKKEETEDKFKMMKQHFDAGVAALGTANDLKAQIKSAPADQKASLQAQRITDCTTAASEFAQALQGLGEKEVNNRAMILGNMGNANECAGKYQDAADAFQKAIDTKPVAGYYIGTGDKSGERGSGEQRMRKRPKPSLPTPARPATKRLALDPAVRRYLLEKSGDCAEQQGPDEGSSRATAKSRSSRPEGPDHLVHAGKRADRDD